MKAALSWTSTHWSTGKSKDLKLSAQQVEAQQAVMEERFEKTSPGSGWEKAGKGMAMREKKIVRLMFSRGSSLPSSQDRMMCEVFSFSRSLRRLVGDEQQKYRVHWPGHCWLLAVMSDLVATSLMFEEISLPHVTSHSVGGAQDMRNCTHRS